MPVQRKSSFCYPDYWVCRLVSWLFQ